MSAFYVGQRVRVVGSTYFPWIIGMEGVVVSDLMESKIRDSSLWFGHRVVLDGMPPIADGGGSRLPDGREYSPRPEFLQPITQLDNTATTWDEMPCDRNGKFKGIPA